MDLAGLLITSLDLVARGIRALKAHTEGFCNINDILSSCELQRQRIQSSVASLSDLLASPGALCVVFELKLRDIRTVSADLDSLQEELAAKSNLRIFLTSARLVKRLYAIENKLGKIDESLITIGVVGQIVSKKVDEQGNATNERLDVLASRLSQGQASDAKVEAATTDIVQDVLQSDLEQEETSVDWGGVESAATMYNSLGMAYYLGKFEKRDYVKAARYLRKAFEHGKDGASYYLGELYYAGNGVEQNFETAFEYYEHGANQGHPASMHKTSWCLNYGHGVAFDVERGAELTLRAVQAKDPSAMWILGWNKLHGFGMDINAREAVKLLKDACKGGEIRANDTLALCYDRGIEVEHDPKKAFELWRDAHDAGVKYSTAFVARCYMDGIGVERDVYKAAQFYRECYEWGTWESQLYQSFFGMCLVTGSGVPKDEQAGLEIIQQSLQERFAHGWFHLAECHRHGYGVKKNAGQALRYYRRAAKAEHGSTSVSRAHYSLASMYENGEGTPKKMGRAIRHYLKAANKHVQDAQWQVAIFVEKGYVAGAGPQVAFNYFEKAANSGHLSAQRKVGEYYLKGHGVERCRDKAIEHLEDAARRGDNEARNALRRSRFLRLMRMW